MGRIVPVGTGFPSLEAIRANPVVPRLGELHKVDLGLDLSSSCVGWVVGVDRKPVRHGKMVYKSTAGIGEKLACFEDFLSTLLVTYQPERIIVEKPLARAAKTTQRHYEVLGVARKVWSDMTGGEEILESWIISPRTVKRTLEVSPGANHTDNKLKMVNKINQLYSLSLRFDPNSKLKSDDDIADAIAVLLTYWRLNAVKGR